MSPMSKRHILVVVAASLMSAMGWFLSISVASAQMPPVRPVFDEEATPRPQFDYEDIVRRARELSAVEYDGHVPTLPESITNLDFDTYSKIRFKPERSLLGQNGSDYRMQLFHPGNLFKRPVTVNVIRDGVPTPVPYSPHLFDAVTLQDKKLPVNLGFAGFRLHYPLNSPLVSDELISFLGASYFRFLGRNQQYGLSARGLAINSGGQEEFPSFREFWVEQPASGAGRIGVYALLDSASVTGAFQFYIYPGKETVLDVTATLFMRKPVESLGIAPLTSMFFVGENDRRFLDEYRPELHNSDGLLVHSSSGEWIWRPLRNPTELVRSSFMDKSIRGFGLLQRDRNFEHYQDIDLHYEKRPGYWVEPIGDWGPGRVELVEMPTNDETNDNIVVFWMPDEKPQAGQTLVYRYRLKAIGEADTLHSGGKAVHTYQGKPKATGASEIALPGTGTRRFLIDFAGNDLAYYALDPARVNIDASVSGGKVLRTFLRKNPQIDGFRAEIDVEVPSGETVDVRAFLHVGDRALTETWIYPWKSP